MVHSKRAAHFFAPLAAAILSPTGYGGLSRHLCFMRIYIHDAWGSCTPAWYGRTGQTRTPVPCAIWYMPARPDPPFGLPLRGWACCNIRCTGHIFAISFASTYLTRRAATPLALFSRSPNCAVRAADRLAKPCAAYCSLITYLHLLPPQHHHHLLFSTAYLPRTPRT